MGCTVELIWGVDRRSVGSERRASTSSSAVGPQGPGGGRPGRCSLLGRSSGAPGRCAGDEGATDICKFYVIDEKKQSFEKFAALEAVHANVESKLDVMRGIQAQPASFSAARQSVQKALNHSVVKSYLQHYDVIRITQAVQTLFVKFEELQETQTYEFPVLLSGIQSDIAAELASCDEAPTFFTERFVRPFLSTAKEIDRLDFEAKDDSQPISPAKVAIPSIC